MVSGAGGVCPECSRPVETLNFENATPVRMGWVALTANSVWRETTRTRGDQKVSLSLGIKPHVAKIAT